MQHRASTVRILAIVMVFVFAGLGCKAPSQEVVNATRPMTIKFWRVFDDDDAYGAIFAEYQKLHPNISIDYRRLRLDEYEKELLSALAEDRGPDIISLPSTWIPRWRDRLLPSPDVLSVAFREIQGTIKKEAVTVIKQVAGATPKQVANDYVDVVASDVILPTEQADPRAPLIPRVYGLPLFVDTMVLYYNRDLLNRAGIAQPASDWKTFQDQMEKLTKLDETGAIIQSGAALGTADNLDRPADILALLMLQNGTPMTDANGVASFEKFTADTVGRPLPPGAEALTFYTDFANPTKKVYSWNDKMPNAIDAFTNGQTAYFFGYSYHLPTIRRMSSRLNFGIAPFPQIGPDVKPVHYANYWVQTVSKKTTHPTEAWDLVLFMSKPENATKYLLATKKPTALRGLINAQLENLDLSVFASEVPTAKSWYHGTDALAAESAFKEMIRQMIAGDNDPVKIMEIGATKVNQTIE